MRLSVRKLYPLCRRSFNELSSRYGLKPRLLLWSRFGPGVAMRNRFVTLRVTFDEESQDLILTAGPTSRGDRKEYPVVDLGFIFRTRCPDDPVPRFSLDTLLDYDYYEQLLREYAVRLDKYAPDLLEGELGVLKEAESVRVRYYAAR